MGTPNHATSYSITELKSKKQIKLDSPEVYVINSLNVDGFIIGNNIGVKTPLFFTTNRNMTIDGVSFSVYDLRKYTHSIYN